MCSFCRDGEKFIIEEAYGRNKLVNEQLSMCVDIDHMSIDFVNKEANGFYIDINYCPKCGEALPVSED